MVTAVTRPSRPRGRLLTPDARRTLRDVAIALSGLVVLALLRVVAEALNLGTLPWN